MLIRYATLALLIPVLGGTPAWAQNAPKMNYLREVIDLTELIPPPPPRESEAWKQDLAEVLEMQQNRTDMQVRRAIADNVLSIYRFEDVLGPKYKKQNLPVTDAFFEKLHSDQRAILIAAKNALQRPRRRRQRELPRTLRSTGDPWSLEPYGGSTVRRGLEFKAVGDISRQVTEQEPQTPRAGPRRTCGT